MSKAIRIHLTAAAPWTKGPWITGPAPHGHCRIYSADETHAIARTYSPVLNGIAVCQLTDHQHAANARLISLAPEIAEAIAALASSVKLLGGDHVMSLHRLAKACRVTDKVFKRLLRSSIPNLPRQSVPWTPAPWAISDHRCIRDANGAGVCQLTGPQNAADAHLIESIPEMAQIVVEAASLPAKENHIKAVLRLMEISIRASKVLERLRTTSGPNA